MRFTQHIVFYADSDEAVLDLMASAGDAEGSGFIGGRVLRFRDKPGRYVVQADFESLEIAEANNDRPETQEFAKRLGEVARGEIKWENFDVLSD
jgi:quinol monooxygenase YgiN